MVYPFTTTVAEQFGKASASFKTPTAESTGTGGGFKLFCGGVGVQHPDISYLKRMPLTALKIDQSFVRDLVSDPDDCTLAATIIAIGHGLGLQVVAEGVETSEQRRILLDQGCDLAQGYFFEPPHPQRISSHN